MNDRSSVRLLQLALGLCLLCASAVPLLPAVKNWALVASVGNKVEDVSLTDLVKFCKGTQKAWSDGKSFTLVMHDPESPEMRGAVQKLFGVAPAEIKPLLTKLNESRVAIKIVNNDDDIMRTVESIPGAVGLVDVYAINSSVKVLRIDGKLPFDVGYSFKGN
jgi:ribosomal protein L23